MEFKTLLFKHKDKGFAHPVGLNHGQYAWGMACDLPMLLSKETTIKGLKEIYALDFEDIELKEVELKIK
jgi:hypothetical protein